MTISYSQKFALWGGFSPATSPTVTPNAANDTMISLINDGAAQNLVQSLGAPFTNLSSLSYNTGTATLGYVFPMGSVPFTYVATDGTPGSNIPNVWAVEYSGVSRVSNYALNRTATPGTGVGAIPGTPVVVPVGSVLAGLVINVSGGTANMTSPAANINAAGVEGNSEYYAWFDYQGAGASITPTFTSVDGATMFYVVFQFLLTPPGKPNVQMFNRSNKLFFI